MLFPKQVSGVSQNKSCVSQNKSCVSNQVMRCNGGTGGFACLACLQAYFPQFSASGPESQRRLLEEQTELTAFC
jgi:hypothetical protein